jgi:hypothetical protein
LIADIGSAVNTAAVCGKALKRDRGSRNIPAKISGKVSCSIPVTCAKAHNQKWGNSANFWSPQLSEWNLGTNRPKWQ